jgi:hypothetical protein
MVICWFLFGEPWAYFPIVLGGLSIAISNSKITSKIAEARAMYALAIKPSFVFEETMSEFAKYGIGHSLEWEDDELYVSLYYYDGTDEDGYPIQIRTVSYLVRDLLSLLPDNHTMKNLPKEKAEKIVNSELYRYFMRKNIY